MKQILTALIFLIFSASLSKAQVYTKEKSRFRFAQTYVGINTQVIPSQGQLYWDGAPSKFPDLVAPRFTIGGLHFWGKWDFNINIPLVHFGNKTIAEGTDILFSPGGDLSARYYPWRMEFGKIRPYAGVSFNQMVFGIKNAERGGRDDIFITASSVAGLSFAKSGWQLNAEWMWLPTTKKEFYTSRRQSEVFEIPQNYFSIGITKYFDSTLKEEAGYKDGSTEAKAEKLRKKDKLNSFSVGIAPSGSYFLMAPKFTSGEQQSLPRHKGVFNWEFGLGYLMHDAGLHVGLTYRDYTSESNSYGLEHLIRRRSLAVELIKFFWDYNGFVPFVGPSIGVERWAAGEYDNDNLTNGVYRTRMLSPGIIFGWDIIASPLETWILRTNLRYYPLQKIENSVGKVSRVDQFEFNIIQLVIYPNRIINTR